MKVKLIEERLGDYIEHLEGLKLFPQGYLWNAQHNFEKTWDIEALDFKTMFNSSFFSKSSQRLWKREHYFPKEMMMKLIDLEKETMRSIFKDLLNEEKDLNLRVNRFLHHLDQMLQVVQRSDRKASTHYHQDLAFIFIYLSFCYPANYTLYDEKNFINYLIKVEARKIPRNHDPILFRNMMKATRTIIMKNQQFLIIKEKLSKIYKLSMSGDNLWTFDFYNFVSTGQGRHKDL